MAAKGPTQNPLIAAMENKEMAVAENTNTGNQHSKDGLPVTRARSENRRERNPHEREKMETQEPQEDEVGDIVQNQKRQAISNEHAQISKDGEEGKMEIQDEKQPERRWPGGG